MRGEWRLGIEGLLRAILHWAGSRADIRAAALVGSHARGEARPDSDVDLLLLATDPGAFRADQGWPRTIDWTERRLVGWHDADYGAAWSRHLRLDDGTEIEIAFAAPTWASARPVDPGTRRVVADGCRILLDRDGLLEALVTAAPPARREDGPPPS